MRIILKGLIDRRKLRTHVGIMVLVFTMFSVLSIAIKYQSKIESFEMAKEEYRTVVLKMKVEDIDIIKNYESSIERMTIDSGENSNEQTVTLLFQNRKGLNTFLDENIKLKMLAEIHVYSDENTVATTAFKAMFCVLGIAIFVLLFVFSVNHFHSLKRDISLFKVLGFKKRKILTLLYVVLTGLYFILFSLSQVLSYVFYIVLSKLSVIDYYEIFAFDFKVLFLIMSIELLSLFFGTRYNEKRSELAIVSEF